MTLGHALVGTRVREAFENYTRIEVPPPPPPKRAPNVNYVFDDGEFWSSVLAGGEALFHTTYTFPVVALSSWVARVPGLYWTPASKAYRDAKPVQSEAVGKWQAYPPIGKSTKVLGGIGTVRMSPKDGRALGTLTSTLNVSAGIPILMAEDELAKRPDGTMANHVTATWKPMPSTWSAYFPSTAKVPKGYLELHEHQGFGDVAPVLIHPFSIMEYIKDGARLYDFVFATADTSSPWRDDMTAFFEAYKTHDGRAGKYLTHADHITALWDSEFETPALARAHLDILGERVRQTMLGENVVEALVRVLAKMPKTSMLEKYGNDCDVMPGLWFKGGSAADEAANLVHQALAMKKLDALVEVVSADNPSAFITNN